mgnify:FL=1
MNSDTYNIDLIDSMIFETTDEPDCAGDNMKSSYRLTDTDIADMPDDTRDIDALRCLLSEYFDRFKNGYSELELKCDIKRDTFQRVLKLKNGINITYTLLAKFCLGAELSVEETRELFELNGHILNKKDRYDYILLCEIERNGTVEDYDNDLKRFKYKSILSDPVGRTYKDE